MKSKEFDTVKAIRSIRDKNYEITKGMTRRELLEWYNKRGKAAINKLKKSSKDSTVTR